MFLYLTNSMGPVSGCKSAVLVASASGVPYPLLNTRQFQETVRRTRPLPLLWSARPACARTPTIQLNSSPWPCKARGVRRGGRRPAVLGLVLQMLFRHPQSGRYHRAEQVVAAEPERIAHIVAHAHGRVAVEGGMPSAWRATALLRYPNSQSLCPRRPVRQTLAKLAHRRLDFETHL